MRILIVESERGAASLLKRAVERAGWVACVGPSAGDALRGSGPGYDALILDLCRRRVDALQLCGALRLRGDWTPIMCIGEDPDDVALRVSALDSGADDFLCKPFAPEEMLARLRALMRRGKVERPTVLSAGGLVLDPSTHHARRDGVAIDLSVREFALLEYFMRRPGKALDRASILNSVWGLQARRGTSNVVDVYVRYLRAKIDEPFGCKSIDSIRGVGYRFRGESNELAMQTGA